MNTIDLIIVGLGLVAGWFGVSALIDWLSRRRRAAALDTSGSRDDIATAWPTILGVAADASPEEIQAGYESRLKTLRDDMPGIQTNSELEILRRQTELLDSARETALAAVNGAGGSQ